jgi:type I restriction enzyme S subunit
MKHQEQVSSLLSGIQNQINLNSQISKTLEDIAQTIFKSWFIDFDPVKAKMAGEKPVGMDDATAALFPDSMEDSGLGLIPCGWIPSKLEDFAEVKYGAPFASKFFNTSSEGLPLIRIRDLKTQVIATWTSEASPKGFLVKPGQLLVGMDGEFSPVLWFGEDSLVNQRVCLVQNKKDISPWFLYFKLLPILRRIENGAAGSTVIHIGKGDIDAITFSNPGGPVLKTFSDLLSPMLGEIAALNAESRSLIMIRDSLLPRLISGELQIPEEMLVT